MKGSMSFLVPKHRKAVPEKKDEPGIDLVTWQADGSKLRNVQQITDVLALIAEHEKILVPWEVEFVQSVAKQYFDGPGISRKQYDVLTKITSAIERRKADKK